MSFESHDTFACADVPDFSRGVERRGHQLVSVSVEVETDDLGFMALQREDLLSGLDVPQFGGIIHTSRSYQHTVWVERETNDLHGVALERMVSLASICVPNLGFLVKAARHNFVAERIVKRHRVHNISVLVEREELLSCHRVPDFAGAIVGPSDELVSRLVKRTVSEGEQMSAQNFEESKLRLIILHLLFDQLLNQLTKCGSFSLRN